MAAALLGLLLPHQHVHNCCCPCQAHISLEKANQSTAPHTEKLAPPKGLGNGTRVLAGQGGSRLTHKFIIRPSLRIHANPTHL